MTINFNITSYNIIINLSKGVKHTINNSALH